MTTMQIPNHWTYMPEWLKTNEWLIENHETTFVKRLVNTVSQLQMDQTLKQPHHKPMDSTKEHLFGDESAKSTKFQYAETLKELSKLTGEDAVNAEKALLKFKEEFSDYVPFLESK